MAHGIIMGGGGAATSSDELTATKDLVVSGRTYMGADTDDDIGVGTLADHDAITAANSVATNGSNYYVRIPQGAYRKNATSGYPEATGSLASLRAAIGYTDTSKVLSGTTIAGMNGTLTVSPATNFNAAQYANKTPQCTWARPAHGSMWSGIRILWRTDRYPENVNDGNVFYEGADVYGRKNIGTNGTIYFGAWSYLTTNYGRIYSARMTTSVNLSAASGRTVLTSSGTFTVPANVRHIKVFMIGGGAEGGHSDKTHGGGGGGGYPNTVGIDVSPGQQIGYAVGNGGSATVFGNYSASPGDNIQYYSYDGGNGGSGGGACKSNGGSNGGSGGSSYPYNGGSGRGEAVKGPDGVYYAGGGGGGGGSSSWGVGGNAGGGDGTYASRSTFRSEWNGQANTGGGGGGEGGGSQTWGAGKGGSGIIIVGWGDQEW